MNAIRRMKRLMIASRTVCALIGLVILAGCMTQEQAHPSANIDPTRRTSQGVESRLRVGDQVQIRFDTGGGEVIAPQSLDTVIDEQGEISLTFVGRVKVEGLTPSELAQKIQTLYVPRFFVRCNVTVLTTDRFFYVGGEVRSTGRYTWGEDVTLLKAINMAGSFTEYSNRSRVEVTRAGKKTVVNADEALRNPAKDLLILPGDSIWVPRSMF